LFSLLNKLRGEKCGAPTAVKFEIHYEQGNALREQNCLEEALRHFEQALALNPQHADAHFKRGSTLQRLNRLEEALASYDKVLAIDPQHADAHYNRGTVMQAYGRQDEAIECFEKSLAINPDEALAYNNLGILQAEQLRVEDAIECFDKATGLMPDYAQTYWNKSLLLILTGKYQEGWKLYEWRFKTDSLKGNYYKFPKLAWRGEEDIRGKHLLIYAEQGLGDTIHFCRYLTQISALGAEIILEIPKTLVPFISTLNCPMTIVAKGSPLPRFDAYCPMMSLPYAFNTTVETIPAKTPYLFSDKDKVQRWQKKMGDKKGLRVGLVWSGSALHTDDLNRSIRLEELLPLTIFPIEWHSMQKEYQEYDLEYLKQHPEIQQHQEELNDFSDTAALVECMDLVISVDTSVAHVAGSIGKPVWILLPFAPDFRWMLDREDSPWYPTARLFRQSRAGDWQSVVAKVQSELSAMIQRNAGHSTMI